MRKINNGLLSSDFINKSVTLINDWFREATKRFNLQRLATNPVVGDVPLNQWGIWENTTTGKVSLIVNDSGTLKSVSFAKQRPVVHAQATGSTVLATGVNTKLELSTEVVDTEGAYDAPNSKLIPQTPGYYWVSLSVLYTFAGASAVGALIASFAKNGGVAGWISRTDIPAFAAANQHAVAVSGIVFFNGSTDYLESFAFQNTGGAAGTGITTNTYLSAYLIEPT